LLLYLKSRLHLGPRYRQRVVSAPLNFGHPTWEDDPQFEPRKHVLRHKLDAPGGDEQLKDLAGRIFTGTLDRDKPLWELHYVEGLSGKRTAIIFKIHHCMVDGIAGVGLTQVLFDPVPVPREIKAEPYRPRPMPDAGMRLYDALWDNLSERVAHWTRLQRGLVAFGEGFSPEEVRQAAQKFAVTIGNFLLPLTKLPFNRTLTEERRIAWRTFSFAEARAIRAICGGTLNDVALTIVTAAVRRYLVRHPAKKLKSLPQTMRILVPVNIREETERGALGNRISFLPVEVPLRLDDPVERLHSVHHVMNEMKEARLAGAVNLMFEALQGLPPMTQAMSLGAISSPSIQNILSYFTAVPPANLICTNVPGPQVPLYLMGHRLEAIYPTLPVCLEMGVDFAITSYDQQLFITVSGDGQAGGEVELLSAYLEESFLELRNAAAIKDTTYIKVCLEAEAAQTAPAPPRQPVNGRKNAKNKKGDKLPPELSPSSKNGRALSPGPAEGSPRPPELSRVQAPPSPVPQAELREVTSLP
ncbi:MAG: wax ester/triacylglycerol synthase family O-acyltransferase, partial [Candidatus Hydrogenedentes bacterium]|nr:wax ester/triacylglycerol synthase family O-acyltransferase [Candidatus Hydrogenedentota bacterium]